MIFFFFSNNFLIAIFNDISNYLLKCECWPVLYKNILYSYIAAHFERTQTSKSSHTGSLIVDRKWWLREAYTHRFFSTILVLIQ